MAQRRKTGDQGFKTMVSLLIYFKEHEVTPTQDPGQNVFCCCPQQRSPHKPPSLQLKQPSSTVSCVHNMPSIDTVTTQAVLRELALQFWTGLNSGPVTLTKPPSTG